MAIRKCTLLGAMIALLVPLAMAADTAVPTIVTVPYDEQGSYIRDYRDGLVLLQLPIGAPKDLVTVTAGKVAYLPRPDNAYPGDEFGDGYAIDKADLADFAFDVHVKDAGLDFTSHCYVEARQEAFTRDKLVQFDIKASASFLSPCGYKTGVRVVCGIKGSKENPEATCVE